MMTNKQILMYEDVFLLPVSELEPLIGDEDSGDVAPEETEKDDEE